MKLNRKDLLTLITHAVGKGYEEGKMDGLAKIAFKERRKKIIQKVLEENGLT